MKDIEPSKFTWMERVSNGLENKNPLMPFLSWGLSVTGLGMIDRFIAKRAADYAAKRVDLLMNELDLRITELEPKSENFLPALKQSLEAVVETQSKERARYLALVLADTWNHHDSSWDEIAQSLRLIRQLEDVHILVLKKALELNPKPVSSPQTFSIASTGYLHSVRLEDELPNVDPMLLLSCCSDLVAMGLMNDSFTMGGSFGFGDTNRKGPKQAPVAYSISLLGRWLLSRIEQGVD